MTGYEIFAWLHGVAAVGGGVLGVVSLILLGRAHRGNSPSQRFYTSLIFFAVPFSFLCRLLSKPLEQQSTFWICLQVAVVALCLAAGAAEAFRKMGAKEDL